MAAQHHVVCIDTWVKPPELAFDHRITQYDTTLPEQLPERIKDATIVVTSAAKVTRAGIEAAPNLQLVTCNSTGTDQVDRDALRDHNITLCHVPAQNTESVSEHAFALYYAIRRQMVTLDAITKEERWTKSNVFSNFSMPPRTNAEETLVIIGLVNIASATSSND
jgi:glycerate dehydrogenase